MRKVKNFENVIKLHEVYESQNNVHLVLELVTHGELYDKIKSNGTFEESEACLIMKGLLKGLVALQQAGIVHRDIKPENIILS